jgi:uracil-DNA glycosylase family 4
MMGMWANPRQAESLLWDFKLTHYQTTRRGGILGNMTLPSLQREVIACKRCPRLIAHCQEMARVKRRAYLDWTYWGKPCPSFGDPQARVLLVGLAPGAHGSNRTGRMFTGDRSGDILYDALYQTGFASQPTARSRDDGLELRDCYITAAVRCAPPDNKPTPEETQTCSRFLERELQLLKEVRVVVALGKFGFDAYLRLRAIKGAKFGHGSLSRPSKGPALLACYHPSQQNTFTGKLTLAMLVEIFRRARALAEET